MISQGKNTVKPPKALRVPADEAQIAAPQNSVSKAVHPAARNTGKGRETKSDSVFAAFLLYTTIDLTKT